MVFQIWSATDNVFVILDCFLPFYPLNNPKNQNFEKLEKKNPWKYHHFTQGTKNHDHMLYSSLDMTCYGFNYYFSFWAIFHPFTSLIVQKIKI